MKYTEAKFNRRYKVGEFEHEDYTLTAILEDGDKADKILIGMKADVTAAFSGEEAPAQEPKKTAKKTGSKKTPDPEPEAEDEDEIPEDPEDEEEESEEEEEEEQEEKPAKDKKKFKKKPQSYDRENEQHKEIYSSLVLRVVAPDWKKTDQGKQRAKDVSKKMVGKDFLDEAGEVLAEFKAEVKKLMAAKK